MKLLYNQEVVRVVDLDVEQVSVATAQIYQSVFALDPWNEAGIDEYNKPITIADLTDDFTPYHTIDNIADKIRSVLSNTTNIFILSATDVPFKINTQILDRVSPPLGEFLSESKPVIINKRQVYINGFLWVSEMPTQDILESRGDFSSSSAMQFMHYNNLEANSLFINEMAVADRFQKSDIGRNLKNILGQDLITRKQTIFANTFVHSGAFRLFSEMGGYIISGPGVHEKQDYVLSMKQDNMQS